VASELSDTAPTLIFVIKTYFETIGVLEWQIQELYCTFLALIDWIYVIIDTQGAFLKEVIYYLRKRD
jgi:hypothetical protein